jgi:uracil-DNA glycosylase
VPAPDEIARCRGWIRAEIGILRPRLVIAVGRLAMEQLAPPAPLVARVGGLLQAGWHGHPVDWIALPHPSGVSAWPKVEPGRTLLARALETLAAHPAWNDAIHGAPGAVPGPPAG